MFFSKKEKLNIENLKGAFELQRKNLIEKNYPELLHISLDDFNNQLNNLWKSVEEKTKDLEVVIQGNIPLLIVVTKGNINEKIKKASGHTELDFKNISQENNSNNFYAILDVEDGQKMVAKSAKDSIKKFEKEKRSALNFQESIALITHYPEILKNHYFISAGSFYNKDGQNQPLLWLLDEDHNPELHYAWFDIAHGSYGTGSYLIKI